MKKIVLLSGLPMPPSSNNCYVTDRKTGRRFPSGELKAFKKAMGQWALDRLLLVSQAQELFGKCPGFYQDFLRVDRYVGFNRRRLWLKDKHELQKLDATNRIKCLDDELAEMLGVDDRYFTQGSCEKVEIPDDEPESVTVVIGICTMRSMAEILGSHPNATPPVPLAVRLQAATIEMR